MPDIDKQIAARVEAFVADLSEFLRKAALQQAADILAEQANAPLKRGRARKRPAPPRQSGRRSPADLERLAKRMLAAIKAEPGRRVDEIAKSLSTPTKALVIPTRMLLEDKKITRKGQRRATRYFPKGKSAR